MNKAVPAILQSKKKLKVKKQKEELTQADLQRLKVLVAENIRSLQDCVNKSKENIQRFWKLSDKSIEVDSWEFKIMNLHKQEFQYFKQKLFNLEQTQKRIKSMLSS